MKKAPAKKATGKSKKHHDWKPTFLASTAAGNTVTIAAKDARVAVSTIYECRDRHPEFAAQWKLATESGVDILEQEAWRRAREKSDILLIFLLKSRRRAVFGDRITHAGDKDKPISVTVDWKNELARRLSAIAQRRAKE